MLLSRNIQRALFEQAFLTTRDNSLLDSLNLLSVIINAVQIYGFVFQPRFNYGAASFQNAVGYTLLETIPHGVPQAVAFALACAVTIVMGATAAIVSHEMFYKGAVSQMWALKVLRTLAALSATILLFPVLSIMLSIYLTIDVTVPAAVTTAGVSGIVPLILATVLMPVFLGVSSAVYFFTFDPNPLSTHLFARASAHGWFTHLLLKTTVAVTFIHGTDTAAAGLLFIYTAYDMYSSIMHPTYFCDLPNLFRGGFAVAHFVGSCITLTTFANPQTEGSNLPWVTLAVSLSAGLVGAIFLGLKFQWLDPVRYVAAAKRQRAAAAGKLGTTAAELAASTPAAASSSSESSRKDGSPSSRIADDLNYIDTGYLCRLWSDSHVDIVVWRLLRYHRGGQLTAPWWNWLLPPLLRTPVTLADSSQYLDRTLNHKAGSGEVVGNTASNARGGATASNDIPGASETTPELIEMAAALLQMFVALRPHSSHLWVRYVSVLALACTGVDRRTLRRLLHTAVLKKPSPSMRYCLFFISKHLQRAAFMMETGQEMDVLELMRYQHDLKRARTHQAMVIRAAARFWRAVSGALNNSSTGVSSNADDADGNVQAAAANSSGATYVMTLSDLAHEIVTNEESADVYYTRLLESFPSSRTVLRLYASYVSAVKNEPEACKAILEYVDNMEDEESRRVAEGVRGHFKRRSVGSTVARATRGGAAMVKKPSPDPSDTTLSVKLFTMTSLPQDVVVEAEVEVVPPAPVVAPSPEGTGLSVDESDSIPTEMALIGAVDDGAGTAVVTNPSQQSSSSTQQLITAVSAKDDMHKQDSSRLSPPRPMSTGRVDSNLNPEAQGTLSSSADVTSSWNSEVAPLAAPAAASATRVRVQSPLHSPSAHQRLSPLIVRRSTPRASSRPLVPDASDDEGDAQSTAAAEEEEVPGASPSVAGDTAVDGAESVASRDQREGTAPEGSVGSGHMSDMLADALGGDGADMGGDSASNLVMRLNSLLQSRGKTLHATIIARRTATFARSMILTLLLLVACIVAIYVTGKYILTAHNVEANFVSNAGSLRRGTQDIAFQARQLELISAGLAPFSGVGKLQTNLNNAATGLAASASSLYNSVTSTAQNSGAATVQAASFQVLQDAWTINTNTERNWDPYARTWSDSRISLWSLYTDYTNAALAMSGAANTSFSVNQSAAVVNSRNFRLVMDNGITNVFSGTWNLVSLYQNHYSSGTSNKNSILFGFTIIMIILPLVLTAAVFMPAFYRVRRERLASYALFKELDATTVDATTRRLEARVNKRGRRTSAGSVKFSGGTDPDAATQSYAPSSTLMQAAMLQQTPMVSVDFSDAGVTTADDRIPTVRTAGVAMDGKREPPVPVVVSSRSANYAPASRRTATTQRNLVMDDAQTQVTAASRRHSDADLEAADEAVDEAADGAADGDAETRETQQLRRIVLPYLLSVSILLALGLALAAVLMGTNALFGSRAIEINYAGARRSQTYRTLVLAQELIRNDSSTWPSQDYIRALMQESTTTSARLENAVLRGDAEWGLPGILGRDPTMDAMHLQPQCALPTTDCLSLEAQYALFISACTNIINTPNTLLTFTDPNYLLMRSMATGVLSTLLNNAKSLLLAQATPILSAASNTLDALFGVAFVLFVVAALLLRAAVGEVRSGIYRVRRVLMMLPASSLAACAPVDKFIHSGMLDAVDVPPAKSATRNKSQAAATAAAPRMPRTTSQPRGMLPGIHVFVASLFSRRPE